MMNFIIYLKKKKKRFRTWTIFHLSLQDVGKEIGDGEDPKTIAKGITDCKAMGNTIDVLYN